MKILMIFEVVSKSKNHLKMGKTEKTTFLDWNFSVLTSTFKKINLNIILIVILDALFYSLSGYLTVAWFQRILASIESFNVPSDILALGPERAQQFVSEIRKFYYLQVFSFILLVVAIIFLASIIKGIIWAKTTKTKITLELISRFLGLNLVWMGFWAGLIFLISNIVERTSSLLFIIATIILALYFTNILYTIFMKKQKFGSIIDSIKLGIVKIHLFLLPYALIFLIFFILAILSRFLKFKYADALLGLIALIYFAVVRYYVSEIVLEIEKG